MATQASAATREAVNTSTGNEVKNDLLKETPLALAKTDISKLEGDALRQYAEAAQARLHDATHGGLLVDKRTGLVFTAGSYIGNITRPIKAMNVIPSAFKVKEDNISKNGEVELPVSQINKGHEALVTSTVGALRFLLAGQEGNGVNLVGQKAKSIKGAAEAMGTIKGGMA